MSRQKIFYSANKFNNEILVSINGGNIHEWKVDGKDIFLPHFINEQGKPRGGMHACWPWFGSMGGTMAKHGFLRQSKLAPTIGDARIEFMGKNLTLHGDSFPWEFKVESGFIISKEWVTFYLNTLMTQVDEKPCPYYNPGFHPYFPMPAGKAIITIDKIDYHISGPTDPMVIKLKKVIPITIKLSDYAELTMALDAQFTKNSAIVLWTDSDKYVCVEPVYWDFKNKKQIPYYVLEYNIISMHIGLKKFL